MENTQASEAWQGLDLASLSELAQKLEKPEENWLRIALALAHRDDALGCMESCEALGKCETKAELGGRSAKDWITLGQRYIDDALMQLGIETDSGSVPLHPNYFGEAITLLAASLRKGKLDYKDFASTLFEELDPMDWLEGPPLLLRLAITANDTTTIETLICLAKEHFPKAPWLHYLESQAKLHADADFPKRDKIERVFFARSLDSEAKAILAHFQKTPDNAPLSSLAGLRAALDESGDKSAIIRLRKDEIQRYLDSGAALVIHEERPVYAGFALLRAYDPSNQIVLMDSMNRVGFVYRSWEEQAEMMALYDQLALVFWEKGKPADFKLEHDESLELLGATETDQLDASAGRARQEELAKRAVEGCSSIARAWQLHGQALLAQLKAGEIESEASDGPFERWYGQARTRFAEAEWAHQLYAGALEQWGQHEEAAIAWNDAFRIDSRDARNLLGLARTRARENLINAAMPYCRDALAKDPSLLDAWRLRAELAATLGDDDLAKRGAAIVLQVNAGDPSAHSISANCAENDGDLQAALAHVDQASEAGGGRHLGRASMLAARLGDFDGAQARALAALDAESENYYNHLRAAACFLRGGHYGDAMGILEFTLSRFGPHEDLVTSYAKCIADILNEEECQEKVRQCISDWAEHEWPLVNLGQSIADAGYVDLAMECYDAAHKASPDALNPGWQKVQCYLRNERREEAAAVLKPMVENSTYPHAHALWTEIQGEAEPDACWESISKADASVEPALVWGSALYLATLRKDEDAASGLKERILSVPAHVLSSALSFLAQAGAFRVAEQLLPLLKDHPELETERENLLQVQAFLAVKRGEKTQAASFLSEMHREFPSAIVTWKDMSTVLDSGDAEILKVLSEKALKRVLRGSPESFGDSYTERGYAGAAAALDGDFAPLEKLLAEHPQHLAVLECAVRAAHGRSESHEARWRAELSSLAPGRAERVIGKLTNDKNTEAQA